MDGESGKGLQLGSKSRPVCEEGWGQGRKCGSERQTRSEHQTAASGGERSVRSWKEGV